MIASALWRTLVVKEARPLLPIWAAASAAVWLAQSVSGAALVLQPAAMLAYIAGAVAIGALAVGHEYAYRTLPMLLAQPIDRRSILALKLGVATALALALAVTA